MIPLSRYRGRVREGAFQEASCAKNPLPTLFGVPGKGERSRCLLIATLEGECRFHMDSLLLWREGWVRARLEWMLIVAQPSPWPTWARGALRPLQCAKLARWKRR